MAKQQALRPSQHNTRLATLGFAALIAALLVIAWIINVRSVQPVLSPATPVSAPAAPAANTGLSNRYFADELAGAHAQSVDAAVLTDPLPERMQDLSLPVMAVDGSGAPGSNLRNSNRFFADEILSSTANTTWNVPETTVVQPLVGPR